MKVKYSPSVNPYDDVSYAFDGDKIQLQLIKKQILMILVLFLMILYVLLNMKKKWQF